MFRHGVIRSSHIASFDGPHDLSMQYRPVVALRGENVQAVDIFQSQHQLIENSLIASDFAQS